MNKRTPDVTIVGAGVVGLTTAWYLAQAGHSVRVLERDSRSMQASWAGAGIISPLLPWRYPAEVQQLATLSQGLYPELVPAVSELAGQPVEFTRLGMLILDADELEAGLDWATRPGNVAQRLEAQEATSRFPGLHMQGSGLFLPDVFGLRNPHWLRALVVALRHRGVEISFNTAVAALSVQGGAVTGVVSATAGELQSGAVVVASGAWSGDLLAPWRTLQIRPVRGQMLVFDAGDRAPPVIVQKSGRYLVPRADGQVLCGSTTEEAGFVADTSADAARTLSAAAAALWPPLQGLQATRHWAGLRPATSDELPCIGAVDGVAGLYVNTGHYRHGITTAPASAQKLVAEMLN